MPNARDYAIAKMAIADQMGIPLNPGYNGNLTSRDAGRIGGEIGGNMVRRMIQEVEEKMAQGT